MVAEGVTVHVAPVELAQLPPLHAYAIAAGLQFAVRTAVAPDVIEDGAAVKVQVGASICAVTVTVEVTALPVPPALTPATE